MHRTPSVHRDAARGTAPSIQASHLPPAPVALLWRGAKASRAATPTPVACAEQDASGRDHSTRRARRDLRGGRAGDACSRRGPHRRRRRRHRQLGRACQDRQLADRRPGSDGARDGGGRDGRSGRLRRGRAARGRRGDDTPAAAPASRDVGGEGTRGGGAPKAVNAAPGQAATTLKAVADGGRLATITGDPPREERGVAVSDVYVRPDGRQLSALAELLAHGTLSVPIASVPPLEQATQALREVVAGADGAIVLSLRT